jgi:2-polyprenyl-3-methyl-5-hydroxy-6-metoxy-1,4-benzoquinol methylase
MAKILQTAERHSDNEASENVIFQRLSFAYECAKPFISGKVIEIGSGEGYGLKRLAPLTESYTAIDKYKTPIEEEYINNKLVEFFHMEVPPLQDIPSNYFDKAISFQVIEHIEDDMLFLAEIQRVLKPGGQLILTTPNIKMSLTRNPWHVREYTLNELTTLLQKYFSNVEMKGIAGNKKVMDYYYENKKGVEKFTRFDIFNLQYRLPRKMLQIPYDILNRINRRMIMKKNNILVNSVSHDDYFLKDADDTVFDFFCIATK